MKVLRIAALLATILFPVFPAWAQAPTGTSSIEGMVTRAGTGDPISGIKVTLIYIPPPAPRPLQAGGGVGMIADRISSSGLPPTVTSSMPANAPSTGSAPPASSIPPFLTDSKGTFAFRNLGAGTYRLTIAGNGYVPQEYGRTSSLTFALANSGSITLSAGQALTGIAINLTPTGNVSGRVLDFNGQPLIGVPVNLYRSTYNPTGERNPTTVATVRTNDRGEYRIFWIAPGRYYLVAGGTAGTGRPLNSVNNDTPDSNSYSIAFYPQGSDIDEASSIDIRPGSDLSGYNFRVAPQSGYSVTGKLIDARTGQPPANGGISVAGRSPMGARASGGRTFYDPATGTFEITDLIPGTYNLTSTLNERLQNSNASAVLSASSIVQVKSADVRDVILTIAQSPSVSGQIKADIPLPAGLRMQVRLQPASSALGAQGAGTQVNADGSFTFDGNSFRNGPGDFRVTMGNGIGNSGLPAGWYMKEAKLGETDAMNTPARFPSSGALTIVLSSTGGQISGVVRNEQKQPVPRMQPVLIPDGPDGMHPRPDLTQQATTDNAGRFTFANVPPGNYKLFAWEDVESGSWFDPDWLKGWEQKGTAIHIAEGSRETVDVQTISAGGAQ